MTEQLLAENGAMFALGLMGSGHCAGMCGGITAALGFATGPGQGRLIVCYNLGRVATYALIGALAGGLGYLGAELLGLGPWLRVAAGILLILMGFYLSGWWSGLARLEILGAVLWRRIQPLGRYLFPVTGPVRALALGGLWGWLPCGLVYTALAYSLLADSAADGALRMAAFGLGTAPAMILGGLFSGRLREFLQSRSLRAVMSIALILFGIWTAWGGWQHRMQTGGEAHGHHHAGTICPELPHKREPIDFHQYMVLT